MFFVVAGLTVALHGAEFASMRHRKVALFRALMRVGESFEGGLACACETARLGRLDQ